MGHSVGRCCYHPKINSCHTLLPEPTFKGGKRRFSLTVPVACRLNHVNNGPQQWTLTFIFSIHSSSVPLAFVESDRKGPTSLEPEQEVKESTIE